MPPGIVVCGAGDGDRVFREYRRGVKQRAVMFAAVKAVAQTNPVGPPRRQQPDLATETAAGEVGHGGGVLWGARSDFNRRPWLGVAKESDKAHVVPHRFGERYVRAIRTVRASTHPTLNLALTLVG